MNIGRKVILDFKNKNKDVIYFYFFFIQFVCIQLDLLDFPYF